MVEYDAKVVLAKKVWEQIDWFTRNFPTEIGAIGIVKLKEYDGEKAFYVEELLFPKQKVTGATVNFDSAMWGELVKERTLKGLENIAFYWHRHPGSASHSGTDEEHTFGAFMDPKANRPYFIFYQTAIGSSGFDEEARIELRKPIRATITNVEVTVDDPENKEIEEECKKIAEKCIVKEPVELYNNVVRDYNGCGYGRSQHLDFWQQREYDGRTYEKTSVTLDPIVADGHIEQDHFNNDIFKGVTSSEEDKVSITFENGQVTILAGTVFDDILKAIIKDKDNELTKLVRQSVSDVTKTGCMIKWNLQPSTGSYQPLKQKVCKLYADYLKVLKTQYEKDGTLFKKVDNITETTVNIKSTEHPDDMEPCLIIESFQDIGEIVNEIEESFHVDWIIPGREAVVREFEEMEPIGRIEIDKDTHEAFITGQMLLFYLNGEEESPEEKLETKVSSGGKKNGNKK